MKRKIGYSIKKKKQDINALLSTKYKTKVNFLIGELGIFKSSLIP